jgi:hypothetical protein
MERNILKIYGNGWFESNHFPEEMLLPNSVIIVDEYVVLEEIEKNDNINIIYVQVEPKIILDKTDVIIKNAYKCAAIYAYDKLIIENCLNARKYVYGTTWIKEDYYLNIDVSKKKFMISVIVGSKTINNAKGHLFRKLIYDNQDIFIDNKIKLTVYISSRQEPILPPIKDNKILFDDKIELFDKFQYSIVIENSKQENYISEKLIDCLITKTIPIYYGCPNISDYFDTSYWIILNNTDVHELNCVSGEIRDGYYEHNYDNINQNYIKSIKYANLKENLMRAGLC